MDILAGILILLYGLALATMGLRIWFWMLPLLGFLAGFTLGSMLVYQLAGDGVLQTVLSWGVGFIGGIAFALVSWFWWYAGVIIAAASSGGLLASALLASFGVERGWVLLVAGAIGALLAAGVALVLNLPIYLVIANTAIAGAVVAISGLLLVLNRIDLNDLGDGHAVVTIEDSLLWWLLWIGVAVAGMAAQLRFSTVLALPQERFVPAAQAVRHR